MEPHTASRLRERRANKLKDYTAMTGPLGVSHLFLFSRSKTGNVHLRVALTPRGPTMTFRVDNYVLAKDVMKVQRRPKAGDKRDHASPPLLVMNNFSAPPPKIKSRTRGRNQTIPRSSSSLSQLRYSNLCSLPYRPQLHPSPLSGASCSSTARSSPKAPTPLLRTFIYLHASALRNQHPPDWCSTPAPQVRRPQPKPLQTKIQVLVTEPGQTARCE